MSEKLEPQTEAKLLNTSSHCPPSLSQFTPFYAVATPTMTLRNLGSARKYQRNTHIPYYTYKPILFMNMEKKTEIELDKYGITRAYNIPFVDVYYQYQGKYFNLAKKVTTE